VRSHSAFGGTPSAQGNQHHSSTNSAAVQPKPQMTNISSVLQSAQSMVDNLHKRKSEETDSSITNLARYKQKMKESQKGSSVHKTTVQETMSKLQDYSRQHGGGYASNNFSSLTPTDKDNEL